MKKKPFNGVQREHRVNFVQVIPVTTYVLMSQAFEKIRIPEGTGMGLRLLENPRDIARQFSSEPCPVVQELMPSEKSCARSNPIEKTIERRQPVGQSFGVKIVQLTNSLGKDAPWCR